ncbi:hypothetical protein L208DRAFT_1365704 [Tricholoma matsutake]|nr:hypothetical protein L208DRAFT_1365704 [Tricholoma matsutake 945]
MTYIGQIDGIKGYRFMWPTSAIFIGTTATFDETLFPYCKTRSIPTSSGFGELPPDEPEEPESSNTPGTGDDSNHELSDNNDSDDNRDPSSSKTRHLHKSSKPDDDVKRESKSHDDAHSSMTDVRILAVCILSTATCAVGYLC